MADIEALTDLQTPWCVHVVATLRIADHLAAGVTGIEDLAAAAACDAGALHNVLAHLVSKGVFVEASPGVFALNDAALELQAATPFLDLEGIGGRMARAWSTLPAYVRTGRPAYAEAFGLPFWDDLAAHPRLAASFDDLIGPGGHGTPPLFALVDGWEGVGTVVDVGGGTGAMLIALLRAHPLLSGTLVDLPGTVERALSMFEAAGLGDRVSVSAQSFFEPLPAGGDLYVLRSVLNDWPADETTAILARCAEAVAPGGRVVVIGGVAPDDAPRRLDIEMVLLGGTTDTVEEFSARAAGVGLTVVAAGEQEGRFVVECRRAS